MLTGGDLANIRAAFANWKAHTSYTLYGRSIYADLGVLLDHVVEQDAEIERLREEIMPTLTNSQVPRQRFYVDEREGCIAVRDRTNDDPDSCGLHPYTPGVVWFERGFERRDACPHCQQKMPRVWHLYGGARERADAECRRLNSEMPVTDTGVVQTSTLGSEAIKPVSKYAEQQRGTKGGAE